jgi:hypothetical protein
MIRKTGRRGTTRYQVRCTEAVALDMSKMEGSLIIERSLPHRPEMGWDALNERMTTWTYQFEGTPSYGRWASFGRVPEMVETR